MGPHAPGITYKFILGCSAAFVINAFAASAPFTVQSGLFDQTDTAALGLATAAGAETFTIFAPSANTDHYSNGVVLVNFKGKFYCQWQSSAMHEDSSDTWVAYSRSADGKTWESPRSIIKAKGGTHYTSGGWWVNGDTLIAYVNAWPDSLTAGGLAYYAASTDGETWSALRPVLMKDGSAMQGIIEQDPHRLSTGRIAGAAHFLPGLIANPVYTDDTSGVRGWVKATFTNLAHSGTNSRELEPSLYERADGNIVMIFRDQNTTYTKLASMSGDNGASWTSAVPTDMPDSRAKQSAGNLPDGTAYFVSNPADTKRRMPLTVTLSADGRTFTKAYNLRTGKDLQAQRYAGKYKTLGYSYPKAIVSGNYLYVGYSTNKEDVECTRIPLKSIELIDPTKAQQTTVLRRGAAEAEEFSFIPVFKDKLVIPGGGAFRYSIYSTSGKLLETGSGNGATAVGGNLSAGFYLLKISGNGAPKATGIFKTE